MGPLREPTYRLYLCCLCAVLVCICSECDHGNIYCSKDCRTQARRASQRRASARYQRTLRGARKHALRQQRWRERRKVTHQGCESSEAACSVLGALQTAKESLDARSAQRTSDRCSFCGALLPAFARLHTWRWSG
jgi:hypothetical protein